MNTPAAFTLKSESILDMLKTDISVSSNIRNMNIAIDPTKTWQGLWDTGASRTSIDKRIAKELGLIPIGKGTISTANGTMSVNTYFINLTLINRVTITDILVAEADLGSEIDLLIGMDIIRHGDFSITNTNGATTFSFRIPSMKEIDYVNGIND